MSISPAESAHEILEVVPLVMRVIRAEVRSHRGTDLSVPQFRTLAFLNHYPGASLSEVAEHIGLTLPSMSKMIDGLVTRQLVSRNISPSDRRRVTLALTDAGRASLQASRSATQTYLEQRISTLPEAEQAVIIQAMHTLRTVFGSGQSRER